MSLVAVVIAADNNAVAGDGASLQLGAVATFGLVGGAAVWSTRRTLDLKDEFSINELGQMR